MGHNYGGKSDQTEPVTELHLHTALILQAVDLLGVFESPANVTPAVAPQTPGEPNI